MRVTVLFVANKYANYRVAESYETLSVRDLLTNNFELMIIILLLLLGGENY